MSDSDAVAVDETEVGGMPSEVACLLIPVMGDSLLLLPNGSVAEILPMPECNAIDEAPPWYLGKAVWRGLDIPVVSLESLDEQLTEPPQAISHLAVFNGNGKPASLPFYGVSVTGIPRLVRVSSNAIGRREGDVFATQEMLVLVNGEPAIIPKLEFIEQQILDLKMEA